MVTPVRPDTLQPRSGALGQLLAVLVLCLLLASCGGGERTQAGDEPPRLSERELTWIRAYSRWAATFWDDGFTGGRLCRDQLAEAGTPPTRRLRPALAGARSVCDHVAGGATDDAERAAEAADDVLWPLLLEGRSLPVRSGVATSESHIDLELGLIASTLSEERVEVSCWSKADWERFVGESNAWTDGDDDFLELLGRVDVDGGRMHLRLVDCNLLVSFRREQSANRSREGLIAAGDAIMTFSHEIGHFADPDASEAEVECSAYRYVVGVGAELQLEPDEVEALVDAYRDEVAPTMPNEYRATTCAASR
jgi:hypothetical protein